MNRVSIVLPTYNRAHLLASALESINRQTYRDFELVIIDDGSTDNTADVVKRVTPDAKYFWQENRGVQNAWNRAIEEANGEYIRFMASDDMLLEDALETEVEVLDANPQVGLLYAQAWQVDEKGRIVSLRRPSFADGSYVRSGREEIKDLLFWDHMTGCTVMVRRRCFDTVGLFDPRLHIGEDWDMWIRIAKKYDVAYIDRPTAKYRKHSGNISMRIDIAFLDYHRRLLLERVFADPDVGHLYRSLKGRAYFSYHLEIAQFAYKASRMGLVRRHLVGAFKSAPGEAFRLNGAAAAALFVKSLIPIPLLEIGRGLMRFVRGVIGGRREGVRGVIVPQEQEFSETQGGGAERQ